MSKKSRTAHILLTSISVLIGASAQAAITNSSWLPHTGRILGTGAAVSDVRTIGGDGMLPIYGQSDAFAYADFMGDYGSDDTYLISPGLGYRKVLNNQIVGGYFFGDYERTSMGENFWVMSPGLEWMNTHWDAHVNGYFPTDTGQSNGAIDYASNYGIYNNVTFVENTHNQSDMLVEPNVVIGNGVDAEVAYSFAELDGLRSRVYLGGYYYAAPGSYEEVDNITGVTAGFEQPINKNLSVSLFNSYDNVNNYAVGVSLTATFGQDSTVFSNNINDRLLDPVERHIGIIDTGAGNYDQQGYKDEGMALQYDNVYFISETGSGNGDGTYGNSAQLTQENLDMFATETDSSRIYIQGDSTYLVNEETTQTGDVYTTDVASGLYVHAGQNFYGTSTDYKAPADASSQPIIAADAENFYYGFIVNEAGENTFSDLTITEYSTLNNTSNNNSVAGIFILNDSDDDMTVNINNTNVTGMDGYGVYARNNASGIMTINTNNSTFNANAVITEDNITKSNNVAGFYAVNDVNNSEETGTLIVNAVDSAFNDNGQVLGDNSGIAYEDENNSGVVSGMYVENFGAGEVNVTAINSQFNGNGVAAGDDSQVSYANGLSIFNRNQGSMHVVVDNSSFNSNGIASGDSAYLGQAKGMSAVNYRSGLVELTLTDSQFNYNGQASGNLSYIGSSHGLSLVNNQDGNTETTSGIIQVTIDNSQFNHNGTFSGDGANGYDVAGLSATSSMASSGEMTINVTNSQFNNNGLASGDSSYIQDASGMTLDSTTFYSTETTGSITLIADNSEFDNNGIASGANSYLNRNESGVVAGLKVITNNGNDVSVTATNSSFNYNGIGTINGGVAAGLYAENADTRASVLNILSLDGSSLSNNGQYGIYGLQDYTGEPITLINYTGATLNNNAVAPTNQTADDNIDWTPSE